MARLRKSPPASRTPARATARTVASKPRRVRDAAAPELPLPNVPATSEPYEAELPEQLTTGVVATEADSTVKLVGSLLIRDTRERCAELRQALLSGHDTIDVGELRGIDTAGAQLLLALAREAQSVGQTLKITGSAVLLGNVIEALGLQAPFAAAGASLA